MQLNERNTWQADWPDFNPGQWFSSGPLILSSLLLYQCFDPCSIDSIVVQTWHYFSNLKKVKLPLDSAFSISYHRISFLPFAAKLLKWFPFCSHPISFFYMLIVFPGVCPVHFTYPTPQKSTLDCPQIPAKRIEISRYAPFLSVHVRFFCDIQLAQ